MSSSPSKVVRTINRAAGITVADAADGLDAGDARKLQIHEGDVGTQRAVEFDCLGPSAARRDDFNVGHDVEKSDKALPYDVVVVDNEDANWISHRYAVLSGWEGEP